MYTFALAGYEENNQVSEVGGGGGGREIHHVHVRPRWV